jgi:hypothetical protein
MYAYSTLIYVILRYVALFNIVYVISTLILHYVMLFDIIYICFFVILRDFNLIGSKTVAHKKSPKGN